ncbi:MAG: hypothetical protein Q8O19_05460, partial [Rectinemataceae bacterium]|nr:hypothetical protein [Rectinemataceae bacterium]
MKDREILRKLAAKVREIAGLSEMAERKKRWYDQNALKPQRPLILCFPEGAWDEICNEKVCECKDKIFRGWELVLRRRIYWWEHIHDDHVEEPFFGICRQVSDNGMGVEVNYTHGENRGSYVWEPPIKELGTDIEKLHFRKPVLNHEKTMESFELAQKTLGDILTVVLYGGFGWSCGLTATAIRLIGLEKLMLAMYDEPQN